MLDQWRKGVMDKILDAHIVNFFDTDEATE